MTTIRYRSHPPSAWAIGLLVLAGLGWAVWTMLNDAPHAGRAADFAQVPGEGAPPLVAKLDRSVPKAAAQPVGSTPERFPWGRRVQGIVRLPSGAPAAGAKVSVSRVRTAWPEWQRERIDQATAITLQDGAFVFGLQVDDDLLIEVEHASYAGGIEELPPHRDEIELRLLPGFELSGLVTNEQGLPLGGVRVTVESVLSDQRRARTETTTSLGGYVFKNLPAGSVRLVARHPQWQPATASALVGETGHVDLHFERPAVGQLRGRVVSAVDQAPIADASIEMMAPGSRLGLVAPAAERTDAGGMFTLSGLPRGPMTALIRHPDHGAVMRTVSIGLQPMLVTSELPPRSSVSGRLVADGQKLEWKGAVLQIRDMAGELDRAVVDAAGQFAFARKLSPGSATITAVGGALAFQRSLSMSLAVDVDEAERTALELHVVQPTVVRGRIVDESDRPLAGVTVQQTKLLAENARGIGAAAVSFDLGSFGSQVAQLVTYGRDQLLTTSLADGTFVIRGQKPGPILARFDLPGRGSKWLRLVVPADDAPVEPLSVVLGPGCQIQGRVTRGDRGLVGAAVTVAGAESQSLVVTGAGGLFQVGDLQPGEYRVRARLPSMPTSDVERTVVVAVDRPTPDVLLEMQPGRIVHGVVTSSDGQPVAGALVTVRGASGQPTLTDSNGVFALELPERAVELHVSVGGGSRSRIVPVRPGEQQLAPIRIDTPPVATLTARVAGLPNKKRLPGGLLRLSTFEGSSESEVRTCWVEMRNGTLRWAMCPVGRVRVQIWCDGYAPYDGVWELAADKETDLDELLLEPGSRLQGRVVDRDGKPVPNASVLLGEEADFDKFEPAVRSGPDGTFRIPGVTSRSATLVVRAPGLAPRTTTLKLPQDVLAASPFTVVLEPGSTIEAVVRSRANGEGGFVQLRQAGRMIMTCELDENGRVQFANRGPGTYVVQLHGSAEPGKEVVVDGSGKVSVDL